jgi:hypothetical protein
MDEKNILIQKVIEALSDSVRVQIKYIALLEQANLELGESLQECNDPEPEDNTGDVLQFTTRRKETIVH